MSNLDVRNINFMRHFVDKAMSRNRILLIVLFHFFHFFSKSQAIFGVTYGINQANFIKIPESYLNPIRSYNAGQVGVFFKSISKKHIRMGVELNYRRKSDQLAVYNSNGMAGANLLDGHFRLDYASILLLPELKFGKKFEWFLNGGIYMGWLVNSTFLGDDISYGIVFYHPPRYNVRENPSSYFPSNEVGVIANTGITYTYRDTWHIGLSFRYFRSAPIVSNYQSNDFGALISLSHTFQRIKIFDDNGWFMKMSNRLEH